jgi:hypothetical protein
MVERCPSTMQDLTAAVELVQTAAETRGLPLSRSDAQAIARRSLAIVPLRRSLDQAVVHHIFRNRK